MASEHEVVACDYQGAISEVAACDELVELPVAADGRGDHGAVVPTRCGTSVAWPTITHRGGASHAQLHCAPSLVPRHMQPCSERVREPAARCRKAAEHHQHREQERQRVRRRGVVRRHCSRTAASLQE